MNPTSISLGTDISNFKYKPTKALWVVTPYYNPCNYQRRRFNYDIFRSTLIQSGIPLLTIECAFGNDTHTLPVAPDIIKVHSGSMIWQKERLLNLAISWLPSSCKFVAWIDCDVLFMNTGWAEDTVNLLNKVPLVQTFEQCNRLPAENMLNPDDGHTCTSFASITNKDANALLSGVFEKHGHTGYGWAARRELLDRHGLYECAIIGSGDHYMAHAAVGDFDGRCMDLMTKNDRAQLDHFTDWARPFFSSVNGNVGTVPGKIVHLWHGNIENRQYMKRNRELTEHSFNPFTDLIARPGKPLEWTPKLDKPALVEMFGRYFASREEDGSQSTRTA